jgi:hypothetical protein
MRAQFTSSRETQGLQLYPSSKARKFLETSLDLGSLSQRQLRTRTGHCDCFPPTRLGVILSADNFNFEGRGEAQHLAAASWLATTKLRLRVESAALYVDWGSRELRVDASYTTNMPPVPAGRGEVQYLSSTCSPFRLDASCRFFSLASYLRLPCYASGGVGEHFRPP